MADYASLAKKILTASNRVKQDAANLHRGNTKARAMLNRRVSPGLAKKPGGLPPGLAKKPGGLPPGQFKKQSPLPPKVGGPAPLNPNSPGGQFYNNYKKGQAVKNTLPNNPNPTLPKPGTATGR